ncbi:metallophosphoesterase [Gordonia araii]|uniref:metallophosphoesterase n=1 Tax=Gordonia araii TaxID=263909 RepID=UPI000591209E|nr:metallophosphoesterase [Gordonia araii]NNG98041.1 metallophosphoesterase [Gordonia araii NBRC 100433]
MIAAIVGITFVALSAYWLHRRLVVATGLSGRWAVAADALLVVGSLVGLPAVLVGRTLDPAWARPIGFVGFTWWAFVFYLSLGAAVIGLVALAVRLIRGSPEKPRRWVGAATGVMVVAAVGAVGFGLVEASRPAVTEDSAVVDRLPAEFDGLRVAFVTDLHVGPTRGADFTRRVVAQVNDAKPDVVILGGDLADGTIVNVGRDLAPLRDLRAPLGVYGVSGNHEYYSDDGGSWLDFWETLGVRPLRNERVELRRGNAVIDLVGVYDATAPEPYRPDAEKAFAGRDRSRALIFAAHQPKQADDAQGRGVGLQVSGHTHGGQIWPFGYAVRLQQPIVAGFGNVGDVAVYASRGAGAWGPPVRVGAPPQISVLTLTR